MKKILFILPSYRYGGTMTSFKNLLLLIHEKYEVSVKAIVNEGDAYDFIVEYAFMLDKKPFSNSGTGVTANKGQVRKIAKKFKDILAYIGIDIAPYMLRRMAKQLDCGNYDAVIGFQEGYPTYLVSKTNAKLKVAWIHSIYSRLTKMESSKILYAYNQIDKIVCVSNTAQEDLIATNAVIGEKSSVVYNALDAERVLSMGGEPIDKDYSKGIHLVSVGRIDPVKRFSKIPQILSELKAKGLDIKWHIIGGISDQKEYDLILSESNRLGVSDSIILEGMQSNPYPFIKSSKLLVCLSSSETFNYTLAEARTLSVPVVTTDFPAAKEFVENGQNGYIAPIEQIGNVIYELLKDEDKFLSAKDDVKNYLYDNTLIEKQLAELIS